MIERGAARRRASVPGDNSWRGPAEPLDFRLYRKRQEPIAARIVVQHEAAETFEQRFTRLADEWRASRNPFSSGLDIFMMPSYQGIVGMGPAALPLIFRALRSELDQWFWALRAISGADPVPDDHLGDLERMREDWERWATARGIEF